MVNGLEDVDHEVASLAGTLLLSPQTWIHRRVEQVAYVDATTVRRRVSVDFALPSVVASCEAASPMYLPIAEFEKRKLTSFDLRDGAGRPLPMLTAEENGHLSAAVLLARAHLAAGDLVDPIVEKYIPILVGSGAEDVRSFAWGRIFQDGTTVGQRLGEESVFVGLAAELSENFVLYLPVASTDDVGRRIIKMAYDSERDPFTMTRAARLGWTPAPDAHLVPLAGYSQSCHVEIAAPPEMEITRGAFFGVAGTPPDGEPRVSRDLVDTPRERAHFNLGRLDRAAGGVVVVALRVSNRELIGGTALLAVLNILVLLFVLWRHREFEKAQTADAIVAAILVVPGALIGYITRPSQHAIVTTFLTEFRLVAAVSATTPFLAGLVLFAGFSEGHVKTGLLILIAFAAGAAAILVGTWLAHRRR
jgi:hypothetical protein